MMPRGSAPTFTMMTREPIGIDFREPVGHVAWTDLPCAKARATQRRASGTPFTFQEPASVIRPRELVRAGVWCCYWGCRFLYCWLRSSAIPNTLTELQRPPLYRN